MSQSLADVYADVVNYQVTDGLFISKFAAIANARRINRAITAGKEVLFPAGTYVFKGVLEFGVASQRCTFLAGAILVPYDSDSYVSITGGNQTIIGLRVEVDKPTRPHSKPKVAHSPLVNIVGAENLLLQELRVSVNSIHPPATGQPAAVRVSSLTKCKFIGGCITGIEESGTIGLWLTDEGAYDQSANEVGAFGLTIDAFGWAVRIGCHGDDPSFTDCIFTNSVDGGVNLANDGSSANPTSYGFNLIGCHMTGGALKQYVQVDASCIWEGGVVMGCSFGEVDIATPGTGPAIGAAVVRRAPIGTGTQTLRSSSSKAAKLTAVQGTGAGVRGLTGAIRPSARVVSAGAGFKQGAKISVLARQSPTAPKLGEVLPGSIDASGAIVLGACIFRIQGSVFGVVVSGCRSFSEGRSYVWNISNTTTPPVSRTCDMFNAWAESGVATGAGANYLVRMTATDSGELTLTADSLRVATTKVGFFLDTVPVVRGAEYINLNLGMASRELTTFNVKQVLTQLLLDLNDLGLVEGS